MNKNLTDTQNDYALFLPATSGFYSTFIGKQRFSNYVDPARVPQSLTSGVESLNYLDPDKGMFYYKWCLYSAGHANLDLNTVDESEDMFRNRNRSTSWVLGDSGGFQIGKGVWPADWKNPNCPKAQLKREQVLKWMDTHMDYGMCLDIPAWVVRSAAGRKATGIREPEEALDATFINNDYFIANRNGNCKFLNVLQGEDHGASDKWYDSVKHYCDTNIYGDKAFNGWAMGGQNMCDIELVLRRIVIMIHDKMLEQGQHDWMHFLGTSKLEWATVLTDIQRSVRKHHNPNFMISFDCASPFLATANGQVYTNTEIEDRAKWVYRMQAGADNKKYATDTRLFKEVVVDDGIFKKFESSPVIDDLKINDICIYGQGIPNWAEIELCIDPVKLFKNPDLLNNPRYWIKLGDLNKIGKVGATSWDSFSYALLMGHNVWSHINAVQISNAAYDNDIVPAMLVSEKFNRTYVRDIIDLIIAEPDKDTALALIKDNKRYWENIPGTRGRVGKKTSHPGPVFNNVYRIENEFGADTDDLIDEEPKPKKEKVVKEPKPKKEKVAKEPKVKKEKVVKEPKPKKEKAVKEPKVKKEKTTEADHEKTIPQSS